MATRETLKLDLEGLNDILDQIDGNAYDSFFDKDGSEVIEIDLKEFRAFVTTVAHDIQRFLDESSGDDTE